MTQTISLKKGWNAIFLTVQPDPADCATVFGGLPIAKVSMWNNHMLTGQFIDNQSGADEIDTTDFLNWSPSAGNDTYVHGLQNVLGGRAYLIHATAAASWAVKGHPVVPRMYWEPDAHNFMGFPVSNVPVQQPRFSDYFAHTDGIDGSSGTAADDRFCLVMVNDGTTPQCVSITSQLNTRRVEAGKAYFIEAQDVSTYDGPLEVTPAGSDGIAFGTQVNISSLHIQNTGLDATTVSVRHLQSEDPPAGVPAKAGSLPLQHLTWSDSAKQWQWTVLPAALLGDTTGGGIVTKTVEPGTTWELRLAVDRGTMPAPAIARATWQSLLEVSDDRGSYMLVSASAGYAEVDVENSLWPAGLWVGIVTLDEVSHVQGDGTVTDPLPMPNPLNMRMLVHVDTAGNCELLQRAVIARTDADDDETVTQIYVDESKVPQDARTARISSIAFGFMDPVAAADGGTFLGTVNFDWTVPFDSPVNPFVHTFHPDHAPDAAHSFDIENSVSLTWESSEQPHGASALWRPEETTSGTYTHTIQNLRRDPITMRGDFRLKRVSKIGELTR